MAQELFGSSWFVASQKTLPRGRISVQRPFRKRWAVLVGVNDYQHFTPLHYCRRDVIELASAFRESLGFQNVFEFHEKSDLKPERESIFIKLGNLRDSGELKPDDLFVFYFSGHGINEGGRDYLLPIGARPRDVKTLGIRVRELADAIKEIGCKNTAMFIDACREAVQGAKGTRVEEASATLLRAREVAPQDAEVDRILGSAFDSGGETVRALEFYESAIRKDPMTTKLNSNRRFSFRAADNIKKL